MALIVCTNLPYLLPSCLISWRYLGPFEYPFWLAAQDNSKTDQQGLSDDRLSLREKKKASLDMIASQNPIWIGLHTVALPKETANMLLF
ncbi:hypothetical protein LMH87_009699 [Akanthomyces muscarius]|uniref:Uncharacterized protein n=1 Tax=Akanthomyces muscarius TaxID=2231603 RepID=A0A9W8QBW1_AKAMU|nr:hypothetical protein LMH87_009699 [Akanthomyces muscarius]KAJ4153200.1 hypothetical protein LMH87_009699 [Akanthomyces muscarius]